MKSSNDNRPGLNKRHVDPKEFKVQREDQGAPDSLDPQAGGEFGTARSAVENSDTQTVATKKKRQGRRPASLKESA